MKTKIILFLLGTCHILLPVQSQVTIGSLSEPRKGSLLELKENENAGENSTKGFSLPRVELESPKILTVDDDSKKDQYKGLTVQNTNSKDGFIEGVYCWDGKMWTFVVAVKDQGTDGQILTSNSTKSVAEWKNQLDLHIPTVDFVGNEIKGSSVLLANTKTILTYDTIYNNKFVYNDGAITPGKSGYYQINIYNIMDIRKGTTHEANNKGTAIITLCVREENLDYTELLSFSAYYEDGTDTVIYQPLSGLIYLAKDKTYVVRTTYDKKHQNLSGGISFTYLGGS